MAAAAERRVLTPAATAAMAAPAAAVREAGDTVATVLAMAAAAAAATVMEWVAAAATTRPCPCCIPRRAVTPRRGTQWIPHSHVQSTQPCGATLTHTGSAAAAAAFTTVDAKPIAK
jgi:hypothetical protein